MEEKTEVKMPEKKKRVGTITAWLPLPSGKYKRYRLPNSPTAFGEITSRWQIDCFMQRLADAYHA